MSEQAQVQQTVFGEQLDEQYRIETTGRLIRPFKQLVTQILKGRNKTTEYRLHVTEDGLNVNMVDAANVIMVNVTIPPESFDTYDIDGDVDLGVSNQILGSLFQHARYGVSTDDELTLSGDSQTIESVVTREIHGVEGTFTHREDLIDPKSIREKPNLPSLDLDTTVNLPVRTFIDVVDALDMDYPRFSTEETFDLFGEDDVSASHVSLDVEVSGEGDETIYSMHYLERISKALHVGKVDEIKMEFGTDFPLFVEFEREDAYSGVIMLAPRVTAE